LTVDGAASAAPFSASTPAGTRKENVMTNIEDCRDEYEAEQAAKADAARKIARNKSLYKFRQGIVDAVIALGGTAMTTEDDRDIFVDGVNCANWIDYVEEREHHSSYRSRPSGKLRLSIGAWGDRASYPQRKDGSFSYDKIAVVLRGMASRKKVEAAMEAARAANANSVAALQQELNLPDYSGVVAASSNPEKPVLVDLSRVSSAKLNMTVDAARALMVDLRKHGIKLSYNDK
jgi:hypothetical protein